jgi:hypothetical protein
MISSEKRTCCGAQHPTAACEHAAQQEASDVNRVSEEANKKSDQKPATKPSGDEPPPFSKMFLPPPFFIYWIPPH